jgi:hypothetical protein
MQLILDYDCTVMAHALLYLLNFMAPVHLSSLFLEHQDTITTTDNNSILYLPKHKIMYIPKT